MRRYGRDSGYSMINVLVAVLVFSLGMLGLAALYGRFANIVANNQSVGQLIPMSQSFWGVLQANPSAIDALAAGGTSAQVFNSAATIATAPAVLQPWMTQLINASSPQSLPVASISITVMPDVASGAACSSVSGCAIRLDISWTQALTSTDSVSATRTQSFFYQFGV